jgi:hypothetical protein
MSNNELTRIKKVAKYGFIDKTGKVVIPIEYDDIWSVNEGLLGVKKRVKRALLMKIIK